MAKGIKKFTRRILKSRPASVITGFLVYLYTLLVGCTTRWQKDALKDFYKIWDKEGSIIIVIWHGRATMIPFFWNKKHPLNALVSMHNDGMLMARLLKHYGLGIIGGSSTANARQAAVSLMKTIKNEGETIAIIPDGPIGPSMKMNMSPLYFAQKSGKPVIGITYSVRRAKIFTKSWDDMMFPFPFNRGIISFTKPCYVPKDASPEQLEELRLRLEREMHDINTAADRAMGRTPVMPGTLIKQKRHKPAINGEK